MPRDTWLGPAHPDYNKKNKITGRNVKAAIINSQQLNIELTDADIQKIIAGEDFFENLQDSQNVVVKITKAEPEAPGCC